MGRGQDVLPMCICLTQHFGYPLACHPDPAYHRQTEGISMNSKLVYVCLAVFVSFFFSTTVFSDVFTPGPSESDLFTTVINVNSTETFSPNNIGGVAGETTQLNLEDGGELNGLFNVNEGGELNFRGGSSPGFLTANAGSEVNFFGGSFFLFAAEDGSVVNYFGGGIGNLGAVAGTVNLFGSNFVLDGELLDDDLVVDQAFTIDDRDVELTGSLADGSVFSPVSYTHLTLPTNREV